MTENDFLTDLDKLIAETTTPPLAENDITAVRVMQKAKCTHQTAMSLIKRWDTQGLVKYIGERRDISGHRNKAWCIVVVDRKS